MKQFQRLSIHTVCIGVLNEWIRAAYTNTNPQVSSSPTGKDADRGNDSPLVGRAECFKKNGPQ